MIRQRLRNITQLGFKELRSLLRDPIMLVLIVYAFSFSIYTAATAMPETLNKAPSRSSTRIARSYPSTSSTPCIRRISCRQR